MKTSEMSTIQLRIINERIKELNQELKEFAILEVEAVSVRDKLKWGLRVAETKELLSINIRGAELVEQCILLERKLAKAEDFDEVMSVFKEMNDMLENIE